MAEKINRWWRKTGKRFGKDRAVTEMDRLASRVEFLYQQLVDYGAKIDELVEGKNALVSSEATAQRNLAAAEHRTGLLDAAFREYRSRAGERLASIGLLAKNFGPSE